MGFAHCVFQHCSFLCPFPPFSGWKLKVPSSQWWSPLLCDFPLLPVLLIQTYSVPSPQQQLLLCLHGSVWLSHFWDLRAGWAPDRWDIRSPGLPSPLLALPQVVWKNICPGLSLPTAAPDCCYNHKSMQPSCCPLYQTSVTLARCCVMAAGTSAGVSFVQHLHQSQWKLQLCRWYQALTESNKI